jgi:TolB protein
MANNRVNNERTEVPARPASRSVTLRLLLFLAVIVVGLLTWVGLELRASSSRLPADPTLWALATSLRHTPTASPPLTDTPPAAMDTPAPTLPAAFGTVVYASRQHGRTHLWAVAPGDTQPIALTGGDWDDVSPAIDPAGERVAFASHREGQWDLYVLDLRSGAIARLTDTPAYEGHPTWSPDGLWLAYEAAYDSDLDIWVIPVDGGQEPIQLTNQPGADICPAWDPNGRTIAFISDREGNPDLYLANLDDPDQRFENLTRTPIDVESAPAYSPDGARLAYSVRQGGVDEIRVLDLNLATRAPGSIGQGAQPAWSPDGTSLAAVVDSPRSAHLVVYALEARAGFPAGLARTGDVQSLAWSPVGLPGEAAVRATEIPVSPPLAEPESETLSDLGRYQLVTLPDYGSTPHQLSDAVDQAFNALRDRVAREAGWDFLGSLEHAFVGLNDPLPPGFAYADWLYTGRAFSFNLAAFQAGWVEVLREDFAGQTYWRIFVRASQQDGSLGEPLRARPWAFDSRFAGDPTAYDQGGQPRPGIPAGYYIDFTRLAGDFGFERLPALTNWRTYYPAARFNEFARIEALDWGQAMLQLYPPEAIITPTPYRTPTLTPTSTLRPTSTPWWWRWRTPTVTRTPTPMPSPTSTPTP